MKSPGFCNRALTNEVNMQRLFILFAILLFARTASAQQTVPTVYGGGHVLSNPRVIVVDWNGGMGAAAKQAAMDEYNALSRSTSVINFLQEYNPNSQGEFPFGAWWPPEYHAITAFNTRTHLYDIFAGTDIYAELIAQITLGFLPHADRNTFYAVHMPPGYRVTTQEGDSCNSWGGIHWNGPNNTIPYVIIPDYSQGTCNALFGDPKLTYLQNLQATISHEIMETVTDPYNPNGWMPEIGDACIYAIIPWAGRSLLKDPITGQSVYTQKMWSNAQKSCVPIEPTTVCCAPGLGSSSTCYSAGAGEKCGLLWGYLDAEIPIVPGSLFSLSASYFNCFQLPVGGIQAVGAGQCSQFAGFYSPAGTASVCYGTDQPLRGHLVRKCVHQNGSLVCSNLHSYVNVHNALCGDGITDVRGQ
jgi:hypothetical protein